MFFDLIYLSWIDIVSLVTFIAAVIYVSIVSKSERQQKQNDLDKSSLSSTSLPPASPTESNSFDEYHEDEDSISLDNLFPCDQSEVYASKKISYIIEELVQTEQNYVDNLRRGMKNYGGIFNREDLPETLKGKKQDLLGNIGEILSLHEKWILPMMQRNQKDLKLLFDELVGHFNNNSFYCYVTFTINKKTSMQLRQDHEEYFTALQSEFKDKLGIDSFLMQPIQRLTRYPLLLHQFISEFYKASINCKPLLISCCKLEFRMRTLLMVVNQSGEINCIEDLNELNLLEQGYFRKSNEFDAFNHKSRKKYRCKVFLFDKCLLCSEVRKKRLAYRCHYSWESIEVSAINSKTLLVTHKAQNTKEWEFSAAEASTIRGCMKCILRIQEDMKEDFINQKYTLPMEWVLVVGFVIWFMFRLL